MKKAYLAFIFGLIAALFVPFVLSAITNIILISPTDNAWTNDTTPDFNFRAFSSTDATFSCGLFINESSYGDLAVANNTNTTITASPALTAGFYSWYINCTDSGGTVQSSSRTIKVDNIGPQITLVSPSDGWNTTSTRVEFKFRPTDNLATSLSCSLVVDDAVKKTEMAANGTQKKITLSGLSRGSHTWRVQCNDSAGNTAVSETRSFTIEEINYCDEGEQGGDLGLTVKKPEAGDDFYPGDVITIEVKVKNDAGEDLEVVVEAALYDLDENENLAEAEQTVDIEEDGSETVELNLTVPFDVNEGASHALYIKAYSDEDEQCKEDSVEIDIKKKSHAIVIEQLKLSPDKVGCGESFNLLLKLGNAGKNDEKVKIEISSALPLSYSTTLSLDEGDSYSTSLPFVVPESATEKSHVIDVKVWYDYRNGIYNSAVTQTISLSVQGNCFVPTQDVSINSQTADAFIDQSFTLTLAITNTGNVATNYSISVSNYEGWASLESIKPSTLSLAAGQSGYVYIKLNPAENAAGMQSFTVEVSFDGTTKTQSFSIELKKQTKPASAFDQFVFELKRNWQWALLIVSLAAAIVVLSILLGKQASRQKKLKLERAKQAFRLQQLQERLQRAKKK